jgi:hypothetical protein
MQGLKKRRSDENKLGIKGSRDAEREIQPVTDVAHYRNLIVWKYFNLGAATVNSAAATHTVSGGDPCVCTFPPKADGAILT